MLFVLSVFESRSLRLSPTFLTNSSEKLRSPMKLLPSKTIFDLGDGDNRIRCIESFGLIWRGFDQSSRDGISCWDLTDPWPTSEKAGDALLLDVIEHCAILGLDLELLPTLLNPKHTSF